MKKEFIKTLLQVSASTLIGLIWVIEFRGVLFPVSLAALPIALLVFPVFLLTSLSHRRDFEKKRGRKGLRQVVSGLLGGMTIGISTSVILNQRAEERGTQVVLLLENYKGRNGCFPETLQILESELRYEIQKPGNSIFTPMKWCYTSDCENFTLEFAIPFWGNNGYTYLQEVWDPFD